MTKEELLLKIQKSYKDFSSSVDLKKIEEEKNRYNELIANIEEEIKNNKDNFNYIKDATARDIEQKNQQIKQLEDKYTLLEKERKFQKEILNDYTQALEYNRIELSNFNNNVSYDDGDEEYFSILEEQKKLFQMKVDNEKEITAKDVELKEIENQIDSINNDLDSIDLNQKNVQVQNLYNQYVDLKKNKAFQEKYLAELQKDLDSSYKQINNINSVYNNRSQDVEKARAKNKSLYDQKEAIQKLIDGYNIALVDLANEFRQAKVEASKMDTESIILNEITMDIEYKNTIEKASTYIENYYNKSTNYLKELADLHMKVEIDVISVEQSEIAFKVNEMLKDKSLNMVELAEIQMSLDNQKKKFMSINNDILTKNGEPITLTEKISTDIFKLSGLVTLYENKKEDLDKELKEYEASNSKDLYFSERKKLIENGTYSTETNKNLVEFLEKSINYKYNNIIDKINMNDKNLADTKDLLEKTKKSKEESLIKSSPLIEKRNKYNEKIANIDSLLSNLALLNRNEEKENVIGNNKDIQENSLESVIEYDYKTNTVDIKNSKEQEINGQTQGSSQERVKPFNYNEIIDTKDQGSSQVRVKPFNFNEIIDTKNQGSSQEEVEELQEVVAVTDSNPSLKKKLIDFYQNHKKKIVASVLLAAATVLGMSSCHFNSTEYVPTPNTNQTITETTVTEKEDEDIVVDEKEDEIVDQLAGLTYEDLKAIADDIYNNGTHGNDQDRVDSLLEYFQNLGFDLETATRNVKTVQGILNGYKYPTPNLENGNDTNTGGSGEEPGDNLDDDPNYDIPDNIQPTPNPDLEYPDPEIGIDPVPNPTPPDPELTIPDKPDIPETTPTDPYPTIPDKPDIPETTNPTPDDELEDNKSIETTVGDRTNPNNDVVGVVTENGTIHDTGNNVEVDEEIYNNDSIDDITYDGDDVDVTLKQTDDKVVTDETLQEQGVNTEVSQEVVNQGYEAAQGLLDIGLSKEEIKNKLNESYSEFPGVADEIMNQINTNNPEVTPVDNNTPSL